MKIALSMDGEHLSKHFGHCESFWIYEIAKNRIISHNTINNSCERPSLIPGFLKNKDIEEVISAGIGQGAINMLTEAGIKSMRVDMEDPQKVIKAYVSGEIKDLGGKCGNG